MMNQILSHIHPNDIYEGLIPLAESITGWGGNDLVFGDLVRLCRPEVIIEVGSWKGQSAITMAEACIRHELDSAIICVDTWLGSEEHILDCNKELKRVNGYPTLYYQFLSNVVSRGVQDLIVPFPSTSLTAAKVLKRLGIKANLIYIDANHEYEAVLADLTAFAPLLADNGIMFGHDYLSWESVRQAVNAFCKQSHYTHKVERDFWVLKTS